IQQYRTEFMLTAFTFCPYRLIRQLRNKYTEYRQLCLQLAKFFERLHTNRYQNMILIIRDTQPGKILQPRYIHSQAICYIRLKLCFELIDKIMTERRWRADNNRDACWY